MKCIYVFKFWIMIVVLSLIVVGKWEVRRVSAGMSARQCKEEVRLGVNACKAVMNGKSPSADCCQRIRVSHVECICPVITPKLAALIDANRALRLVQGCGRRVPRHFKCGSK